MMNKTLDINANGLTYKLLNENIKEAVADHCEVINIKGVLGQRYIGTGIKKQIELNIFGTPGSDLAAFGNGPKIIVHGNGQEAVFNTLNAGEIVIHGHTNDVLGVAMRGGQIFVRDDVGYRAGIHMKAYKDLHPTIVIGGTAQHFLGEYMAGGTILVLGLHASRPLVGDYVGTGMHGGVIYIRGNVDPDKLGKEVRKSPLENADYQEIQHLVQQYCQKFGGNADTIMNKPFTKLTPISHSPYGLLYVS